jgi:high-affinity Fe2+/Pb2+ permease
MENIVKNIGLLYQKVETYSKSSFELLQLKTLDKATDLLSSLAVVCVLSMLLAMFTLMLTIGISLYLGTLLEHNYLGFICVSGGYLVVLIILYIFRKSLIKIPIRYYILSKSFNDEPRNSTLHNSNTSS